MTKNNISVDFTNISDDFPFDIDWEVNPPVRPGGPSGPSESNKYRKYKSDILNFLTNCYKVYYPMHKWERCNQKK